MLVFSQKRLTPLHINMITLKDADNNYYYVHRSLYDQAVILYDLYSEKIPTLDTVIAGTKNKPEMDFFLKNAPVPINILGRFLALIEGSLPTDLEILCGALHVMSTSLDFRRMLKLDFALRRSARFSLSITEEYSVLWERFFNECSQTEPTKVIAAPTPQTTTDTNGFLSAMFADLGDDDDEDEDNEGEGNTDYTKSDSVTPAQEQPQPVKKKSGLDLLKEFGKK
jgi:antitoxin component HigA of HigAB toxin-antitoxin module